MPDAAPIPLLGDAEIEERYKANMNAVATSLDGWFNGTLEGASRHTGFVLMVFPFGESESRCNFISNGADRKDVVCLMKEMIARFEGQPEMKGTA